MSQLQREMARRTDHCSNMPVLCYMAWLKGQGAQRWQRGSCKAAAEQHHGRLSRQGQGTSSHCLI